MYPAHWASVKPATPAVIDAASGEQINWQELNDRSNQVAQLLQQLGLTVGDHVSIFMENNLDYFSIGWGVMRSGMYLTCINRYLTPEEAAYIVEDSNSQVIFASAELAQAEDLGALIPNCKNRFVIGHETAGYEDYEQAVSVQHKGPSLTSAPVTPWLYSSGTTGTKGHKTPSVRGSHQ